MKKSTILKSLGLKSNSSTTSLLKKAMQITAFTFSCLVALPSFVQTADAQTCDGGGNGCWDDSVTAYGYNDPWGDWGGWGDEGQGCQEIGCDSDGGGGGNSPPPATCSATERVALRLQRSQIPGCIGDPGVNFDEVSWLNNETSGFWHWFTTPIGRTWDYAWPSLVILGQTLANNNGDLHASYIGFSNNLSQACTQLYNSTQDVDQYDDCMLDAYYILDNYYPGVAIGALFSNWLFGTDLITIDYGETWGGRFVTDINNHFACHDVYQAWEEEGCTGSL